MTKFKPSFVFLSEPQVFSCDVNTLMNTFAGSYKYVLNSEDSHDPDLPLDRFRAKGGTMAMWDNNLDQLVTVLKTVSPSVLPLLVKIPDSAPTCHIVVYLPTAGLEEQFIEALSVLDTAIIDISEQFDDIHLFIRGDMNISERNPARAPLLSHFLSKFSLTRVPLHHPSYHHFVGDGGFDSSLDVLLYSNKPGASETLLHQICKHHHPLVYSHHDLLISRMTQLKTLNHISSISPLAPKVPNVRAKIKWCSDGIADYQEMIGNNLDGLAGRWCHPDCSGNISALLSATYSLLHTAAISTDKFVG